MHALFPWLFGFQIETKDCAWHNFLKISYKLKTFIFVAILPVEGISIVSHKNVGPDF